MVSTIATSFREKRNKIVSRTVTEYQVSFDEWLVQPQIVLIIGLLESLPKKRSLGYHTKLRGSKSFIFTQGIAGYSGRVKCCLGSFSTTLCITRKKSAFIK